MVVNLNNLLLRFPQSLEEISLEDRNLHLETLKSDLHTVLEVISQSSAQQKGIKSPFQGAQVTFEFISLQRSQ